MIIAVKNNDTVELYEITKVTSKAYDLFFDIKFISPSIEITISYDYNVHQGAAYTSALYKKVLNTLMSDGYIDLTSADFAGWQMAIT